MKPGASKIIPRDSDNSTPPVGCYLFLLCSPKLEVFHECMPSLFFSGQIIVIRASVNKRTPRECNVHDYEE